MSRFQRKQAKCHAIFGPPGTGKTEHLKGLITDYAKSVSNMAVLSFTRAAASVLAERVKREKSLRFVGTIHSLCYQTLGLSRQQVALTDIFIKWVSNTIMAEEQEIIWALNVGNYARRNNIPLEDAYIIFASARMDCPFVIVEYICETYDLWKQDQCLIDFDDMLERAIGVVEPFDIVVMDEAQDSTKKQWQFIKSIVAPTGKLVVAGDDDQSIFTWAGAYVQGMSEYADTKEVLSQSHRIPQAVHQLAERTITTISNREPKAYKPREEVGYVEIQPDYNPLGQDKHHTVLCRDWYTLKTIESDVAALGIPYIVDTGKYSGPFNSSTAKIIRALRNEDLGTLNKFQTRLLPHARESLERNQIPVGPWTNIVDLERVPEEEITYLGLVEDEIDAEPLVTLATIHSFKGKEDDHVVLIGDCTEMVANAVDCPMLFEDEVRVAYVGITRCRVGLTLVGVSPFIPL
jgi:superfamily I DNA/RNA helicase